MSVLFNIVLIEGRWFLCSCMEKSFDVGSPRGEDVRLTRQLSSSEAISQDALQLRAEVPVCREKCLNTLLFGITS